MTGTVEGMTEEELEAEHDRLFAERAAKIDSAKSGEEPEPVPDPEEPKEPAAEPDAPADDAENTDAIAAKPAENAPAKEDDLLSDLPAERRAAIAARLKAAQDAEEKAKNDVRSMAGRVSAYERKYQEAVQRKPVDAAKAASVEEQADWMKFSEDYPEIAKGIEARFRSTKGTATEATVAELAEYVRSEQQSRFLQDAWEAVDAVHPGWRDRARTPEFKAWKEASQTYEKLASSDDIGDAIALFDLYDAHQAKNGTPRATPAETAEAAKLAARRKAQADGAKSEQGTGATPNESVDDNDGDQMFAFYAAKANARMRKRYT